MRMMVSMMAAMALAAGLAGCAPEIVASSGPRPATSADQVRIYQKQPHRYERLGTVMYTAGSLEHWEKTADGTAAFNQMRAEAAALGANGLLLIDDTNQAKELAGARFGGTYYRVPLKADTHTLFAQAIYVLK